MIRLLAGASALALAVLACSEIAGLGSPPQVSAPDGGDTIGVGMPEGGGSDGGASAQDGDASDADAEAGLDVLDPSFGEGGIATLPSGQVGTHGLAIEPDGGAIVYCGGVNSTSANTYILLIGRLLPDGTPDTNFSYLGQVTADQPGFGIAEVCNAVALVPNGSIAAAGVTDVVYVMGANYQMFAARFLNNGDVDPSLGEGGTGFAGVNFPDAMAQANAMVLLSDESMVLGGYLGSNAALAKISANGVVDPTFGSNGGDGGTGAGDGRFGGIDVLTAGDAGPISQMLPRSGGGYIATAQAAGFLTLGLTNHGTIDPTYGKGGLAQVTLSGPLISGAVDMVVDSYGTVCVGSTVGTLELVRFTPDGRIDTTFGQSGRSSTPTPQSLQAQAMALLPDGGGFAVAVTGSAGFAGVARFTASGTLDTAFGQDGYAMFSVPSNAGSEAIAVDGAGRIYLAVGSDTGMQIFRLLP